MSAVADEPMRGYQQNLLDRLRTDGSSRAPEQDDSESQRTTLSEIVVLIAHSDPVISAGLAVLLRRNRSFKVLCARWERSSSLLVGHSAHSVDVVLADYESGIRLTAGESERRSRVVILTHSDCQAKICHALAHGVRGYLLLGFSLQDLVSGIHSVHAGGVAVTPRVASRIAESMNQETLTAREQSVLRQLILGWSNKRIAGRLGVSAGTVKSHLKAIFDKLGARNRGEAAAIAWRRGMVQEETEWQEPCRASGSPRLARRNEEPTPGNDTGVQPFRRSSGRPRRSGEERSA